MRAPAYEGTGPISINSRSVLTMMTVYFVTKIMRKIKAYVTTTVMLLLLLLLLLKMMMTTTLREHPCPQPHLIELLSPLHHLLQRARRQRLLGLANSKAMIIIMIIIIMIIIIISIIIIIIIIIIIQSSPSTSSSSSPSSSS
jgi:hypothetical protein